eukprot:12263682-Prorocentrum_lima.AAC.1
MIIVPPNSKHSERKAQGKAGESDAESQASTQASTTASLANPNVAKSNMDRPLGLKTNKELEKDDS